MKKVVCINDQWLPTPAAVNNPKPQIGDKLTVSEEAYVPKFGAVFYEFEEHPDCFYYKEMFVELPDTPAEVIEEEETETLVYA